MVSFYGAQALAGYVHQPASSLVRLPEACLQATGAGVVAVINPASIRIIRFAAALVPGYDFTRNLEGAAVSEYATAILSQEAGAFLEGSRPRRASVTAPWWPGSASSRPPPASCPSRPSPPRAPLPFAADRGAKVVNMSFTLQQPSAEFTRAIHGLSRRLCQCRRRRLQ